jgi:hypothetical protein
MRREFPQVFLFHQGSTASTILSMALLKVLKIKKLKSGIIKKERKKERKGKITSGPLKRCRR